MDTFTKTERSKIMAKVKREGNLSTENEFILFLKRNKIGGWRRKYPLLGNPDFVFARLKIAVFIDGCFWHGCPDHCRMPATNISYWKKKISGNIKRDKRTTSILKKSGWTVLRIWEHELKKRNEKKLVCKLLKRIQTAKSAL
ncbi:MAG: very short patch repair endonuclease [Acidobacteriota bacterium]